MNLIAKMKALRHELYRMAYSCLPIQNNKIMFWSFGFNAFSCNPKYIARKLEEIYPGHYDIVWVFDVSVDVPEDFPYRFVRYFSLEYMREIATARVLVCNSRINEKQFYFRKRAGQFYIQTWHGSYGPKRIEADAVSKLGIAYERMARRDSEICDLMLASCDAFAKLCKTSCWYTGEVAVTGMPRCDLFFDHQEQRKQEIRGRLGIPENTRVVVYAPTFRGRVQEGTQPDFSALCNALHRRFGGLWVAVRSIHPNLRHEQHALHKDCLILPDNTDVQEVIHISDCVVSDYSSVMIDGAIAGKPVFLFVPDLEEYRNDDRGFYYDIAQTPFILCRDNEELTNQIISFDADSYRKNVTGYLDWMGSREDGRSGERVARRIHQICEGVCADCG